MYEQTSELIFCISIARSLDWLFLILSLATCKKKKQQLSKSWVTLHKYNSIIGNHLKCRH